MQHYTVNFEQGGFFVLPTHLHSTLELAESALESLAKKYLDANINQATVTSNDIIDITVQRDEVASQRAGKHVIMFTFEQNVHFDTQQEISDVEQFCYDNIELELENGWSMYFDVKHTEIIKL